MPVRRMALATAMCLVLGGLGGLIAAEIKPARPAPVHFFPPRRQAFDFRLRDEDGHWTSLRDARGKVVVLTFLYSTCRDLCPAQAADIANAVGRVGGKGVLVYGVSVDPVGDTAQRARRFLISHQLYGGPVKFLIGSRRELRPVWAAYGIVPINATPREAAAAARSFDRFPDDPEYAGPYRHPPRPAASAADQPYPDPSDLRYRGRSRHRLGLDFEHSAYVMLIDKHGQQRIGIPFEQLNPPALAEDLRTLISEP
jgi:protein SCO1/2